MKAEEPLGSFEWDPKERTGVLSPFVFLVPGSSLHSFEGRSQDWGSAPGRQHTL